VRSGCAAAAGACDVSRLVAEGAVSGGPQAHEVLPLPQRTHTCFTTLLLQSGPSQRCLAPLLQAPCSGRLGGVQLAQPGRVVGQQLGLHGRILGLPPVGVGP